VSKKVDEYRAIAAEYDLLAARALSEEAKRELEQIARALRSLADRFDGYRPIRINLP
jgi:hypothetical protein